MQVLQETFCYPTRENVREMHHCETERMVRMIQITGIFFGTVTFLGVQDHLGALPAFTIGSGVAVAVSRKLIKFLKDAMVPEPPELIQHPILRI